MTVKRSTGWYAFGDCPNASSYLDYVITRLDSCGLDKEDEVDGVAEKVLVKFEIGLNT